jgi:hypothetical protein
MSNVTRKNALTSSQHVSNHHGWQGMRRFAPSWCTMYHEAIKMAEDLGAPCTCADTHSAQLVLTARCTLFFANIMLLEQSDGYDALQDPARWPTLCKHMPAELIMMMKRAPATKSYITLHYIPIEIESRLCCSAAQQHIAHAMNYKTSLRRCKQGMQSQTNVRKAAVVTSSKKQQVLVR